MRNNYFPPKLVKFWTRQPRAVVESLSLDVFKNRVDVVLRNWV